MIINIKRINDDLLFRSTNETGQFIELDGASVENGKQSISPMQAVLAAHGSCSSIDVVSILKKQHQIIESFEVIVDGKREQGKDANVFTNINLKFLLSGKNLDISKVERAIQLSVEKYCSVGKILEPTAIITHSLEII